MHFDRGNILDPLDADRIDPNFSDRDRLFFLSSIGRGGGNRRGGVVHASAPHDA